MKTSEEIKMKAVELLENRQIKDTLFSNDEWQKGGLSALLVMFALSIQSKSATINQPSQDTGHLIEFGMYISGHDAETVEQIYQDWNNSQSIRKE